MPSASGFGDAELLRTLEIFPYAGSDAGLNDEERFARSVAKVVRAWLRSHPTETGSFAAFLLHPEVPEELSPGAASYFALDDGETNVTAGIWFVGPAVIQGTRVAASGTFDDLFRTVTDAGLGGKAAVTYRNTGAGAQLRFYPRGLGGPETVVSMVVSKSTVDLAKVLELVDIVHKSTLITPSGHLGGAKLWQNREKHYPVKDAEVEIQAYLRTGLSVGLPFCTINVEQNLVAGRLDLEIEELDPIAKSFERHAILELKVIRSFGSTGRRTSKPATEKWIDEGVDQAHSYREERKARESALCCFDMRVDVGDETCLRKVAVKAKGLGVVVMCWPLYPEAKGKRAAEASAALSAGSPPGTT